MCLSVYFTEDYSEANYINVNAGLFSLFHDHAYQVDEAEREENLKYAEACRTNLETALSALPMHLPGTPDMILALIFGV